MNSETDIRWLKYLLSAIVCLLGVIAIELSVLIGPLSQPAFAQIPDSGKQRMELLDAAQQTHATLGNILGHLKTGTIKVKVVGTDKNTRNTGGTVPSPQRGTGTKPMRGPSTSGLVEPPRNPGYRPAPNAVQ